MGTPPTENTEVTLPEHELDQLLAVATLYCDSFTDNDQMSYADAARLGEVTAIVEKYGRRY